MKKICLAVITALLITGSLVTVQALSAAEIEQKRIELKEKINEAGKNLESINIELTENLEKINELEEDIYAYEKQIKTLNTNLSNVEKQIKETELQLQTIEIRYNKQKDILEQRLVYWYELGPTRYLDVLLNSKSVVDFITNYYLISEIAQYDEDLLKGIGKEKAQIEQIKESLEVSKENLKSIKNEQKKVTISLENLKTERKSHINKLTNEELKVKEEIEIYQDELDLVELEILLAALGDGNSEYVGGVFAWPTPGYYTITSRYGMRLHPVLKVYRNHNGLDIGAPMGTYIIAANDGIVTKSTYSYSYGNMVMVDHGGGVTTLYAHGSEIIANVGDTVKRGDAIMKVGSTGWSTGPHLHFEIRINGNYVDPYPYITTTTENEIE